MTSKRTVFNQLINFFWTITCFTGIVIYWWESPSLPIMFLFITISLISAAVPPRSYQLSRHSTFYVRLGVKKIRLFVQDGGWRHSARDGGPTAEKVVRSRSQAAQYLRTVDMYQRYHLICLVFFTLSVCHALVGHRPGMAILMLASNIIYNVCPLLLQQYNWARIKSLQQRIRGSQ